MNESQILTAEEAATKALDKAHTDLVDAMQAVAEAGRDMLSEAESIRTRSNGNVVIDVGGEYVTDLRDALKCWTDAGNAYMKLVHEAAAK